MSGSRTRGGPGPRAGASPFERFDIDPRGGPAAITERLRELAEDAEGAEAQAEIRAAWEELTRHPRRRFEAALDAHPETRAPIGEPPPRARSAGRVEPEAPLDLPDLIARPRLESALPPPDAGERAMLGPPRAARPLE